MREKAARQGRENKPAGWSANMLEGTANRKECEDTKANCAVEKEQPRGYGGIWKELRGRTEEEVLEKYKVNEAHKGAYQERGEQLKWLIVWKGKRYQRRKG